MIVKGIIKSIDFGSNTCMVRIPTWEPVGNPETVIPAVFSVTPGTFNSYKENDVVWVAFENNIASHPVIIGKLYAGTKADKTEPRGVVNCKSLTVSDSAVLPASTKITQATSEILDERNGLQVKTLEELISAVAENTATISNLVILDQDPTLGNVIYSYAFSASEVSVVQPTDADWDELKKIADKKDLTKYNSDDDVISEATLTKDDLTAGELDTLSDAAQLWLTAGGAWKWRENAVDPNDSTKFLRLWEPQTGYISDEDWVKNYASKDAYPLLNVFKRTKSIYVQQGMDKVVTTEELVRSPRTSYPIEYSLKMTADTHAGPAQTENLYITAVKQYALIMEEKDEEAWLWYWNPNPDKDGKKKWVQAVNKSQFNFTVKNFQDIIKDRDLVVIATHAEAFNPNSFENGDKFPDPLIDADLSTWGELVVDANVYEIETIPYSPLNTPVINLDNDSAALPYDEDGNNVLDNAEVSTTAQVFLNGKDISTDFTFIWYQGETAISDPETSTPTITIKAAGIYDVVATKNKDASPSYSVPDGKLTKTFTVAKQLQGEAMMSSVITSSAGTSFNTKNIKDLTTILTAYLYRGTKEYKPDELYYDWYTISGIPEEGTGEEKEPTIKQLEPNNDYVPIPAEGEIDIDDQGLWRYKSIEINVSTLKDKSIYFVAYEDGHHTGIDPTKSILDVARLGITTVGK